MRSPKHPAPQVESGLILLDSSRAVVSLDAGAAAILNCNADRVGELAHASPGVAEVVQRLADPSSTDQSVRLGFEDFTCRTYNLDMLNESLTEPLVGLLLERHWRAKDAIDEVGARYHLTKREQQALRGLSLGLSTKALAAKMNIRPSTLRAFLRIIKIKMGAPTRGEMMAKILQRKP